MTDYGYNLRQAWIKASPLQDKLDLLRQRMHAQGKYFIGEETLAKRHGGKVFHPRTGWKIGEHQ